MCLEPAAKRVSLFVFHLKYVQSRLAREQAEGFGEELAIKQAIELTRRIIDTFIAFVCVQFSGLSGSSTKTDKLL